MSGFKHVTLKLANMRKAKDWTIYPLKIDSIEATIQSDDRICRFNLDTGAGMVSSAHAGGSRFHHLDASLGATPVVLPKEVRDQVKATAPRPGDKLAPGLYVA